MIAAPAPAAKPEAPAPVKEAPKTPEKKEAPVAQTVASQEDQTPVGFWLDLVAELRIGMKPPLSGLFAPPPNGAVNGVIRGDRLMLHCSHPFAYQKVSDPALLQRVSERASAKLGRRVMAVAVDGEGETNNNKNMEDLLNFGRAHSDIITIKN